MSTSPLYHAFGIRGYTYRKTEYRDGGVHFTVEQSADKLRCVACGSRRVIRKGGRTRRFRGLLIGRRPVWIQLRVPHLGCKACGTIRQAKIPFAPGRHRYTKRFARYVLDLTRCMTMWDVAQHLGVSWGLVKEIPWRSYILGVFVHLQVSEAGPEGDPPEAPWPACLNVSYLTVGKRPHCPLS